MKRHLLYAASVTALVWTATARAQGVDYATFEALFGEPITLSATGTAKRASEAPADITIITADEIQRSGARDLPELLRRVAGVDTIRGGAGSADVAIRGFNQAYSRRIQVLLDGRQVYNDNFTFTTWASIPVTMQEIRQIEIVRGPAVALYGLNAVSGAINIITRGLDEEGADHFEIRAGSDAYVEGQATLTRKLTDTLTARLSLRAAREDQFEDFVTPRFAPGFPNFLPPPSIDEARVDPERFRGRARLGWSPTDDFNLEIDASYAETDQSDYFPVATTVRSDIETSSLRLRAGWRPGDWVLSADAYVIAVDQTATGSQVLASPGEPVIDGASRLIVGKLEASRRLTSKLTFRTAGEFRRSWLDVNPVDVDGKIRYDLFAPSVVIDYQLTSDLTLTGAVRLDYVDFDLVGELSPIFPFDAGDAGDAQSYTQPSGNFAVVYQATRRDIIKALYARGASIPSLYELGGFQAVEAFFDFAAPDIVFPFNLSGDPTIDPTTTDNFELSYERVLATVDGKLRASAFYQIVRGAVFSIPNTSAAFDPSVIFLDDGLASVTFTDRPDARADVFGGEIDLRGTTAGFRWGASYGFLNLDETNTDLTANGFAARNVSLFSGIEGDTAWPLHEDFTSKHSFDANLGRDWGRLSLDLYGGWRSPRATALNDGGTIQRIEVDGRGYLGGRLAYRLVDGLTASVNVNDILDDRETQTGAFRADRRWFASLTYRW